MVEFYVGVYSYKQAEAVKKAINRDARPSYTEGTQ
jgi:hypothetical protein